MRISFHNLGTIERTELDLRPLTVIIGPNNTSKTYVAYSLYGLWQAARASSKRALASLHAPEDDAGRQVVARGLNKHLRAVARTFASDLDVFFQDSSHKLFVDTRLDLSVSAADVAEAQALLGPEYRISKVKGSTKAPRVERLPDEHDFGRRILSAMFSDPLVLPAERNALVMTYKLLEHRRYELLKEAQFELFRWSRRRQLALPGMPAAEESDADGGTKRSRARGGLAVRYPKPVEDFISLLSAIELMDESDAESLHGERNDFQVLADALESGLQGAHRIRLANAALGGRELRLDLADELSIDLYNASSSIKQITPLLLYLRYRAKRGDFLIVDEPEMNLHPEAQAKLLEVFGVMVTLGVRMLLTTHSPYFMAHLNNLVAGELGHPAILKKQAELLYLGDPRAFLNMDSVGAYVMRNNELVSLKDPDYGIRWDTLSEVSVDLQQKFFQISEISEKGRAARGKKR